ncbi:hypothetical protein N752_19425 [Desulforamulus aquiferis]|nr:hypothetical protein N752_19425 [Desulforamulus aquiferis]
MQLKKATTFDEQIQILKQRGLIIDDEATCKSFLSSINYYRFTAYLLPFKKSDNTYVNEVYFEDVYKMYDFDRRMRTLLFGIVEEIELLLRTVWLIITLINTGQLGI